MDWSCSSDVIHTDDIEITVIHVQTDIKNSWAQTEELAVVFKTVERETGAPAENPPARPGDHIPSYSQTPRIAPEPSSCEKSTLITEPVRQLEIC